MGKALGESGILEHVKPLGGGVLYVDIKAPAQLRPLLGFTNYRKSLGSKELDKRTREKATGIIAEYHRLRREAEEKLTATETRRQKLELERARRSTLATFGFADEKDLTEFIDFCASGWPNAETSDEIFTEAVRKLTAAKSSMRMLADVENYIRVLSTRLDTARRLVEACKITPMPDVAQAFDKTITISRYLNHYLGTDQKTKDTERQYRSSIDLFLSHIQDKPIHEVTIEDARSYRDYLHNRRDLSYATCDQRLKKLRAVLNFAVNERRIDNNPFTSIKISRNTKKGHGTEIDRSYVSPDVLNVTLNEIIASFPADSSMRWPYLLMFFTGARIEEVCGLQLDEVGNHWEVNCIHIRPRVNDNRTVKTQEARYTPIHRFLWNDLGFGYFVQARKAQGARMLFDFPQWRKNFYSAKFSDRMTTLRAPIERARKIDLGDQHALRHNIINLLRAAGVSEEYVCLIVGQKYGSRTNAGYGTRDTTLEHLRDAIHRIDLKRYDFAQLLTTAEESISNVKDC